eukprot:GHVL01001282.1.p1 GENE.GHVL01001282.1~~GHVL01001282.1.p1  ORF type:complete len:879 (-),score=162.79 GHVL01001282.1:143-2779(-)
MINVFNCSGILLHCLIYNTAYDFIKLKRISKSFLKILLCVEEDFFYYLCFAEFEIPKNDTLKICQKSKNKLTWKQAYFDIDPRPTELSTTLKSADLDYKLVECDDGKQRYLSLECSRSAIEDQIVVSDMYFPNCLTSSCLPIEGNIWKVGYRPAAYYEVSIEPGKSSSTEAESREPCVSIGMVSAMHELRNKNTNSWLSGVQAGWTDCSWGWHSDDGQFFHNGGRTGQIFRDQNMPERFGVGDTIGCGIFYHYPSFSHKKCFGSPTNDETAEQYNMPNPNDWEDERQIAANLNIEGSNIADEQTDVSEAVGDDMVYMDIYEDFDDDLGDEEDFSDEEDYEDYDDWDGDVELEYFSGDSDNVYYDDELYENNILSDPYEYEVLLSEQIRWIPSHIKKDIIYTSESSHIKKDIIYDTSESSVYNDAWNPGIGKCHPYPHSARRRGNTHNPNYYLPPNLKKCPKSKISQEWMPEVPICRSIFYTKNGKWIGVAYCISSPKQRVIPLRACVGLDCPWVVNFNFGHKPFQFDLDKAFDFLPIKFTSGSYQTPPDPFNTLSSLVPYDDTTYNKRVYINIGLNIQISPHNNPRQYINNTYNYDIQKYNHNTNIYNSIGIITPSLKKELIHILNGYNDYDEYDFKYDSEDIDYDFEDNFDYNYSEISFDTYENIFNKNMIHTLDPERYNHSFYNNKKLLKTEHRMKYIVVPVLAEEMERIVASTIEGICKFSRKMKYNTAKKEFHDPGQAQWRRGKRCHETIVSKIVSKHYGLPEPLDWTRMPEESSFILVFAPIVAPTKICKRRSSCDMPIIKYKRRMSDSSIHKDIYPDEIIPSINTLYYPRLHVNMTGRCTLFNKQYVYDASCFAREKLRRIYLNRLLSQFPG